MENWKSVVGYEGYYEVSNKGQVRSVSRTINKKYGQKNNRNQSFEGKILKPIKNRKGYLRVDLRKNGHRFNACIHRLVAEAFILNPFNKPQVNHIDCDKENNCVDNLEWVNNSENLKHAYANGLKKRGDGGRKKVKIGQYLNGELVATFNSIAEAQEKTGINNIAYVHRGKRKTAGGYEWHQL